MDKSETINLETEDDKKRVIIRGKSGEIKGA